MPPDSYVPTAPVISVGKIPGQMVLTRIFILMVYQQVAVLSVKRLNIRL
jgi:hypothetical protein